MKESINIKYSETDRACSCCSVCFTKESIITDISALQLGVESKLIFVHEIYKSIMKDYRVAFGFAYSDKAEQDLKALAEDLFK